MSNDIANQVYNVAVTVISTGIFLAIPYLVIYFIYRRKTAQAKGVARGALAILIALTLISLWLLATGEHQTAYFLIKGQTVVALLAVLVAWSKMQPVQK